MIRPNPTTRSGEPLALDVDVVRAMLGRWLDHPSRPASSRDAWRWRWPGCSCQPAATYLRGAVHSQAVYLRRQVALARTAERLGGRPEVSADERGAVLDAIADAHAERADHLIDRPIP